MKRALIMSLFLVLVVGCGATEDAEPSISKSDVASANGKGDSADLDAMCEELEHEPGCDPCSVQGWYGDGTCDDFCPVRDTDCGFDEYTITVDSAPGISASMSLIYQATKDSFGCTDLTRDGASFKRVPEQVRHAADQACSTNPEGTTTCEFTFNNEYGDGCTSVIRHIYLNPSDASGSIEPWASLAFVDGEEGEELQTVECYETTGRNEDERLMMCGNDLLYHNLDGTAHVSLIARD